MMRLWIVLVLLLAGCAPAASPSPSDSAHVITGSITLYGTDVWEFAGSNSSSPCKGEGGYNDVSEGAQVLVRDGEGGILATGHLLAGASLGERTNCVFMFSVSNVGNAAFYAIEVSHRGELTYSAAEMEGMDWRVSFTLGD